MSEKIKNWIVQNIQLLINIYLFINILGVIAWQTHGLYQRGHLNLIEITFSLNNGALAWVVLVRQKHVSINYNPWQQLIALILSQSLSHCFSLLIYLDQRLSFISMGLNPHQDWKN